MKHHVNNISNSVIIVGCQKIEREKCSVRRSNFQLNFASHTNFKLTFYSLHNSPTKAAAAVGAFSRLSRGDEKSSTQHSTWRE
jgi:hypothetical protein